MVVPLFTFIVHIYILYIAECMGSRLYKCVNLVRRAGVGEDSRLLRKQVEKRIKIGSTFQEKEEYRQSPKTGI